MIDTILNIIKKYYGKHYTKDHIIKLVEIGRLTKEEYEFVTGEPYIES